MHGTNDIDWPLERNDQRSPRNGSELFWMWRQWTAVCSPIGQWIRITPNSTARMNNRLCLRSTWNLITLHHVRQDPPQLWRSRQWNSTPSKSPQQHRNVLNDPTSKYPNYRIRFASVWIWGWWWNVAHGTYWKRGYRPREAAKQAYIQAWGIFWSKNDASHQNLKTQPGADPVLPRITMPVVTTKSAAPCSTIGYGCDLPRPQSQDDDEDSSPIVQELDRAEHTQCSRYHSTLTQLGFKMSTPAVGTDSKGLVTTGSTRKVTPKSSPIGQQLPQLSDDHQKATQQNPHLRDEHWLHL